MLTHSDLTQNERAIMQVLWQSASPMLVSDIVEADESLTVPTVHRLVKQLTKKGYIKVADIVSSGTVLARRYQAVKKPDDFLQTEVKNIFPFLHNKISFSKGMIAAFLNNSDSEEEMLLELESFIKERKKELNETHEN